MAVLCRPTASASAAKTAGFAAFPNPAHGALGLRQPAGTAAVKLRDTLGRTVLEIRLPTPETQLPVAGLPAGLYAVQWHDAAGRMLASQRVAVE